MISATWQKNKSWLTKTLFVKIFLAWKSKRIKGLKKSFWNLCIAAPSPYVNKTVTPVFVHSESSRWTSVVCDDRNSWLISREQWKVINPGKSTAAVRAVPFCRIWLEISVKPLILFFKKTVIDNSLSLSGVSLEKVLKCTCTQKGSNWNKHFLLTADTCFSC